MKLRGWRVHKGTTLLTEVRLTAPAAGYTAGQNRDDRAEIAMSPQTWIAFAFDCKAPPGLQRPAMNDVPLRPSAVFALAAACVLTVMPTVALGACNMTLRGELVPDNIPNRFQTTPQKLLNFTLEEIAQENGQSVARHFQSFAFENTRMTFPIPFALDIDSPKDCPKEVELHVIGSDGPGGRYEFPLNGLKKFSLETGEFQSVVVFAPTF
jgi:hypothetical protein